MDALTAISLAQTIAGGVKGLINSQKDLPEYSLDPSWASNVKASEDIARYGHTGAQKQQFKSDLAKDNALRLRSAIAPFGNQISGVTTSALGASNMDKINQFYANDASIMSAKIREAVRNRSEYSRAVQRISDMNTSQLIDLYTKDQASGAELTRAGITNMANQSYYNAIVNSMSNGKKDGAAYIPPTTTWGGGSSERSPIGYTTPPVLPLSKTVVPEQTGAAEYVFDPNKIYPKASTDRYGNIYGNVNY